MARQVDIGTGYLLLEACGVEFPDDGHSADVSGYDAEDVAESDLEYFPRLATVDASENRLSLLPFSRLPRLKELKFAANGLRHIPASSAKFQRLLTLDLSYNALDCESLARLGLLCPVLRELDLTANNLRQLPDLGPPTLERLTLERNGLSSEVLLTLARLPKLRDLQLAHNRITSTPEDPDAFPDLEILGLAFNNIASFDDLALISALPKVETVALYGNPLPNDVADRLVGATLTSREGWSDRKIHVNTRAVQRRRQAFTNVTISAEITFKFRSSAFEADHSCRDKIFWIFFHFNFYFLFSDFFFHLISFQNN